MLLPSSIVPLSIGMGRVTACALQGVQGPFAAVAILTHPTLGSPFHPPTHRLLCKSFTRDAPFSQVAMARRRVRRSVRTESGADQVGGAEQRQGHAVTPSLKQGLPPPMPYYFVNSLTRCPSSGRMSFSIARRTAFSEPGVENSTRPLMMPAVALLMMAGEPIS
jgi:hypothetical protein